MTRFLDLLPWLLSTQSGPLLEGGLLALVAGAITFMIVRDAG